MGLIPKICQTYFLDVVFVVVFPKNMDNKAKRFSKKKINLIKILGGALPQEALPVFVPDFMEG